jgi:hypothetical protein
VLARCPEQGKHVDTIGRLAPEGNESATLHEPIELTYEILRDQLVDNFPEMSQPPLGDESVLEDYPEPHVIVGLLFNPMMMSAIQQRNEVLVDRSLSSNAWQSATMRWFQF